MNPNVPQPSFELPALPNEPGSAEPGAGERPATGPETYAHPPAPSIQTAHPVPQPMPPSPTNQQAQAVDPSASVAPAPLIADDTELIEKEWVVKAKQIVAATKEDPYTQTKEMSKFKADYLKKRYNKDLKVEES